MSISKKTYEIPSAREYDNGSAEFEPKPHTPKPLEIFNSTKGTRMFENDAGVQRASEWYVTTSRDFFAYAASVTPEASEEERQDSLARSSVVRAHFTATEANSILPVATETGTLYPGVIPEKYALNDPTRQLFLDAARATAPPHKLMELFVYVPEMQSIELARQTTLEGGAANELTPLVEDILGSNNIASKSKVKISPIQCGDASVSNTDEARLDLHESLFSVTQKTHYDLPYLADDKYTVHVCHRQIFIMPGSEIFGEEWSPEAWDRSNIEEMITSRSDSDGNTARERAAYLANAKDTTYGLMSVLYMYRRKNPEYIDPDSGVIRLRELARRAGYDI